MLSRLRKYWTIASAIGLALLYALLQKEKKERVQNDLKIAEAESEALSRNNEALAESEKIEQETIERVKNTPVNRDHFSKRRVL